MRTNFNHGHPDVSKECWDAAASCFRAGVPLPPVLDALYLTPEARARITPRLRELRKTVEVDPTLSEAGKLNELKRIRCAELEEPIVQATRQIGRKMEALLKQLVKLKDHRMALAADLRTVNRRILEVTRVGIGNRSRLIAQHDQLVAEIQDVYKQMTSILDRFPPVYVDGTHLCDRGLLRTGLSVKRVIELGGVTRSQSKVYRIHQHEKPSKRVDLGFQFSPTLLELLPKLREGHETLSELRRSIDTDRKVLRQTAGHTDILWRND